MTVPAPSVLAQLPATYQPTLRDMLLLDLPVDLKVAPDGRHVAFTVRTTNWRNDCYELRCYLHDVAAHTTYPLTRQGSVRQIEWLDGQCVALLKNGAENGDSAAPAQIWLYEGLTGEGWAMTAHQAGVTWFKPFAQGFLFQGCDPKRQAQQARTDRFGKLIHFEAETSASALYYVGLDAWRAYQQQLRISTEEEAKALVMPVIEVSCLLPQPLSIQSVIPAPGGDAIYLNCWLRDDLVYAEQTSTYRITLNAPAALAEYLRREQTKAAAATAAQHSAVTSPAVAADCSYLGTIVPLALPSGATVAAVAPDGNTLLIGHRERDQRMYTQRDLWLIDLTAALGASVAAAFLASMRNISAGLDREVMTLYWTAQGIFGSYVDGTCIRIARFGTQVDGDEAILPLTMDGIFPVQSFHVAASGHLGLIGANAVRFPEAYLATPPDPQGVCQLTQLSTLGAAVSDWDLGTVETIRWTSKDGVEIEGVLRKPSNFDPTKKYGLAFVVHGGPRWFAEEYLLTGSACSYYPAVQFVHKDLLVLSPNYRGSIGRGQAFAELNVNNLGIGDLWDVESGVDHLVAQGYVDPARVGCMGWSQGGYIAAFAGLHSDTFQAVSVGAGISDWYTYHISNDIPYFTTDYLSDSPFRNRDLYVKTAPISNLANAHTPMLIQHGADDRRVPLANAIELYRGLREMRVPVELFVYPGMGHPITKPRENHAVMHQNLTWFSHYLLGEPLTLE